MTKEQLDSYNIFTLRELARQAGVSSPTSKKKEELITLILEIQSGEKSPAIKTKQGRPPKSFGYDFDLHSMFKPSTSILTLKQDDVEQDCQEMITKVGTIEILENNAAFLWVEDDCNFSRYFISPEMVGNANLKFGDRVVAEVGSAENMVVKTVFNINGQAIENLNKNRKNYSNIEAQIPSKKLEFDNVLYNSFNILQGENVYLYGTNNNQNTLKVIDMLNSAKTDYKIYVNLSVAEKNKMYLSNLKNAEIFVSKFTDKVEMSQLIIKLAINRAMRILELGCSVTIAVDDILTLTSIDFANLDLTKSLITTSKDGKRAGSITLLAVIPNHNINGIEKLADCRLQIVDDNICLV